MQMILVHVIIRIRLVVIVFFKNKITQLYWYIFNFHFKSMVMILVKKDFLILMFTMFKLDILIGNRNLSYKQVTIICYVNKAF